MQTQANLGGMTTATPTRFHESIATKFDRIDRDAGVIHGVRILGLQSRNRRRYLKEAIAKAAPLYEGARVYIDHSTEKKRQGKERWGKLTNVRVAEDGGLIGDLHYLKHHTETERILEAIERFGDTGLSHDSEGLSRKQGNEEVIYEIAHVHSVDVVEKPATTKNFFEETGMTKKKLLQVLQEHRAEVQQADKMLIRLKEMGEMDPMPEGMPDYNEMDVDVMDGGTPDNAVKSAIRMAIMAILDSDDDSATAMNKIKMLMKVRDEVGSDGGTTMPPQVDPVDPTLEEEVKQLRTELAQFKEAETKRKTEGECRRLLEELGREVSDVALEALAAVPQDRRKRLAESFTKQVGRPGSSPPKYPSAGGDSTSYEDVRNRIHAKKQKT